MGFDLDNYVDVPERIAEFRKKYPDGVLQSSIVRWPSEDFPFVVVQAFAYRTSDHTRPGHGLAMERYPGKTPYTKDSELQNAETSAWGRAIVAVLAADTRRGVASLEEVRNRRESRRHPSQKSEGNRETGAGATGSSPSGTQSAPEAHGEGVTEAASADGGGGESPTVADLKREVLQRYGSIPDAMRAFTEAGGDPERGYSSLNAEELTGLLSLKEGT